MSRTDYIAIAINKLRIPVNYICSFAYGFGISMKFFGRRETVTGIQKKYIGSLSHQQTLVHCVIKASILFRKDPDILRSKGPDDLQRSVS